MATYQVVLPSGGHQVVNGNNAMIVIAGNPETAKAAAAAAYGADAAPWDQATVTELLEDASFAGLVVQITVGEVAGNASTFDGPLKYRYTVPVGTDFDTVDEIGAAIVAGLNATPELAAVTYTGGSDTITIVAANNCGLAPITAKVYKLGNDGVEFEVTDMALTVGAVGGSAAADRTIVITPLANGVNPSFVAGFQA